MFWITDEKSYSEFNAYMQEQSLSIAKVTDSEKGKVVTLTSGDLFTFTVPLKGVESPSLGAETTTDLIWGKDPTENVVAAEVKDDKFIIFRELKTGEVIREERPTKLWLISPKPYPGFDKMEGKQHYKFIKLYSDFETFNEAKKATWKFDLQSPLDAVESNLIYSGTTFFKNTRVEDVSILSFDIESSGIQHDNKSRVYMISNTFRKKGTITKRLFIERPSFVDELEGDYRDYVFCDSQADLFNKWSEWVRTIDPSILVGHNIYGYDLPYMRHCARLAKVSLDLGRDGSAIAFQERESKFRKDGSQFYTYHKAQVFGRSIVDTMFLSMKHDIKREYVNYRLKNIIAQEGLEVENRQHYDAGKIKDNMGIKEEWVKIARYAIDDSDDALKLFDMMIPPFFYLTPHIPKIFEDLINRASGSQINSFMMRAYIQEGHSVPKATEAEEYEGAISFGNAGIYSDVWKVDVASLYPSIMRQWKVSSDTKDPKGYFIKMVDYFTLERLANKKKAKETGDKYYTNIEQAQKIVINSAYGFLGARGLNFNSPDLAAFITKKGREILQTSIDWAESKGFRIVNADTDSISFTRDSYIPKEERITLLEELNSNYPELIKFEDDGYYTRVVVVKAKNYVLLGENGKTKIKGAALLSTSKEKALQELNVRFLDSLLGKTQEKPEDIYKEYVNEASNIKDINRWASKKTVTQAVLKGARANETKVLDALDGTEYSEGDKIYVFFKNDKSISLASKFDGDYDKQVMLKKIFNSIKTFESVLDMSNFINYSLKKNAKLLE